MPRLNLLNLRKQQNSENCSKEVGFHSDGMLLFFPFPRNSKMSWLASTCLDLKRWINMALEIKTFCF